MMMSQVQTQPLPLYAPRRLSTADFETASIRSAAPSYISDAPTYHSTLPPSSAGGRPTISPLIGSGRSATTATASGYPSARHRQNSAPSLDHFRIASWSSGNTRANPTARHYQNVAHRRATIASEREEMALMAAALAPNPLVALMEKAREEEMEEFGEGVEGASEGRRLRPLEDPDLVGAEAAAVARQERLVREGKLGMEVLHREDRRWDWLIGQMKDWEEREKSWTKFRSEVEQGKRGKLASRLGLKRGNKLI